MPHQPIAIELAYRLVNHGPTVIVSTTDGAQPNACAVAWCAPASREPPRFCLTIGKRHKTFEQLMASGECVLNLPTSEALDALMVCGRRSGHDGDKLSAAGIALEPSTRVCAPRLACCAAWIECKLWGVPEWAEPGPSLVVLQALAAECRPGVLDREGFLDTDRFKTLHHLGGDRFVLPGERLDGGESS
ncbi:MAG: flavin reductase family protein [Deltaproteobacteria bacterium]|nr:flavin reductase family protein [Deltaproteobacteria bacterium]